jgi:DHA1 family bicyclomycin/chloramphenicol resistance-like MFS transporter
MKKLRITLLLSGLAALGPFSVDTYFPSFPAIAAYYGVSQTDMQQTLSFYLAALAFMNLFHGSISDSFGRRKVILVALVVYIITSFGNVFAPTFSWLLVSRTIQGLSAGAGMIVGRAIVRDRFEGVEAQKYMAQITMLYGLAPAVAPVIGGWLFTLFGFQASFILLAIMGITLLISCYLWLEETHPSERWQPFHTGVLFRNYLKVSRNLKFLALSFSAGLSFAGFLLYVGSAADFILNILHLQETEFFWLFVPIVIGLVGGSALLNRLAGSVKEGSLIRFSYITMGVAVGVNLLYNLFFAATIPWAVLPIMFYTLGVSLLAPNLTLRALDFYPQMRGLAASLQGFIQTLTFAGISGLVAPLIFASGFNHALAMAIIFGLNLICWFYYLNSKAAVIAPDTEHPLSQKL